MTKQRELGKVEYHRNGVGGEGYFMVVLSGADDPTTGEMIGFAPAEDVYLDESGEFRPSTGREAHIPRLVVVELDNLISWAEGGLASNWRGADHWSEEFMRAIHKSKCPDRRTWSKACAECYPGIGTPEWTDEVTFSLWVHLERQDLRRIFDCGGRIRRRDGNGIEYYVQRMHTGWVSTVLSQADVPSTKLIIPTNELIAEFEEVK